MTKIMVNNTKDTHTRADIHADGYCAQQRLQQQQQHQTKPNQTDFK